MRKTISIVVLAAAAALLPAIPASASPITPLEPYLYDEGYDYAGCQFAGNSAVEGGWSPAYSCNDIGGGSFDLYLYEVVG